MKGKKTAGDCVRNANKRNGKKRKGRGDIVVEHTHVLADGTVVTHTHGAHGHQHSHTQTKAVLNRMARLIGHLESIKQMIADGRDCSDVLIQLSAVDSAIKGVSRIILKDHLEHCIVDAVRENDKEALDQLNKAIDRFLK